MKIRNGFVSNSSSSSFIIEVDKNTKITTKMLLSAFDVTKSSPLFPFAKDLADYINNNSEPINIGEIYEMYICGDAETDSEMLAALKEEGNSWVNKLSDKSKSFYKVEVSSEGDHPIELYLYNSDFKVETNTIKIYNEG